MAEGFQNEKTLHNSEDNVEEGETQAFWNRCQKKTAITSAAEKGVKDEEGTLIIKSTALAMPKKKSRQDGSDDDLLESAWED
eukprot:10373731-Karenia_brevis.AAC.1